LTVQDTYPERVLISATGLVTGEVVTITRTPAGDTIRTAIRSASSVVMTTDTLVKVDAEASAGVLLTYTLTVDSLDLDTETTTLSLVGVGLSDAISGASAQAVILAWPSRRWTRPSSVFSIGGRNIVVSKPQGGFSGTIDLFTETDDQRANILRLLEDPTSGVIQIRSDRSATSEGVDCYVSVLAIEEQRYSQDGSDQRRIISLDVVETGPWGPTLASTTFSYADVAAFYTGETYADWALDYTSYLDAAVGEYS